MNDSYVLYKMASQLRKDISEIINSRRARNCNSNINIMLYNNIRTNLLVIYDDSDIVKRLPVIHSNIYNRESDFLELLSASGQIISFLSVVLGDPDKKFDKLRNEINILKEKNLKLEESNKLISESLNKYIKSYKFSVSEDFWNNVP